MSTADLDRLIFDNLVDLEATAQRLGQINSAVWRALDDLVRSWAETHGWAGLFEMEKRGLWVAPASWRDGSEDPEWPDAAIWFDHATHAPDSVFDLTDLCALGPSRYGLRVFQNRIGRADWKELARNNVEIFQELGLELDAKASPFMPVTVALKDLAAAVETGDYKDALQPITAGLDRLLAADASLTPLLFKPKPPRKGSARAKSGSKRK